MEKLYPGDALQHGFFGWIQFEPNGSGGARPLLEQLLAEFQIRGCFSEQYFYALRITGRALAGG